MIRLFLLLSVVSNLVSQERAYLASWWPWSEQKNPTNPSFTLNQIEALEERLATKVIGQPYATTAVATTLLAYAANIHDPTRPIGCFLFIGTTGVGKTELAKVLAREIAPRPNQFIRLNMSEFNNAEVGLNRLIGLPFGYKESEKGGELSNALLKNPYSIVLLDEFEKADEKVRLLFLQIFDEGYFSSNKQEYVDCRNCIFIATTNLGAQALQNAWTQAHSADQVLELVEPILVGKLTPELYNRMEPVLFQSLNYEGLRQIIIKKLEEVAARIYEKRRLRLSFDDSVVDHILSQCPNLNHGARPILGVIKKDILSVIAKCLITNQYHENDSLTLIYDVEKIVIIPAIGS